jgi:hypothetical protein
MTMIADDYATLDHAAAMRTAPIRSHTVDKDVLPTPWGRMAVGATVGVIAATTIATLHGGLEAGPVFVTEITIMGLGLAMLGSLFACISSVCSKS